jgi:hypothetical protein
MGFVVALPRASGDRHVAVVLHEVVPLRHGKGADALFVAQSTVCKPLKLRGHLSVAIEHLVVGRALFEPLYRLHQ